jgi:hypothetical protein
LLKPWLGNWHHDLGALLWFLPLLGEVIIIVAAAVMVRFSWGLRE